mgnify:CR=1 FL=1
MEIEKAKQESLQTDNNKAERLKQERKMRKL